MFIVTVEVKRIRRQVCIAARLDRRTRRQQRVCLGVAAVVSQRSKARIRDANLVVVDAVRQAAGAAGSDQVERAGGIDGAGDVVGSVACAILVEVSGDDGVLKRHRAACARIPPPSPAALLSESAVLFVIVLLMIVTVPPSTDDTAATAARGVAADGRVDERQTRAGRSGADRAAVSSGGVAGQRGVDDRQRAVVNDRRRRRRWCCRR